MFFYYFYNLLTSPGVMMHELSHAFFCVMAGVKIHKIKLFQFGRLAGYVEHDEPQKFYQGFFVSLGPLFINTLFTLFAFSQFREPLMRLQPWVWVWLGFAAGMHAIPSTQDAKSLFGLANRRFWRNPLVIIGYPFVLALYILNFLKRLHIDIIFVGALFWLGRFYL